MFFDSWTGLLRVVLVGVCAYAALVLFLRVSGKRTLAKLNAFDLVVTVALGSILASTLVTKSVAMLEGMLAFALLIALQFALTWLSVRSDAFKRLIKSEPTLLAYDGRLMRDAMRAQRVAEGDLLAAVRSQGVADLSQLSAVVLETDGSFSVLRKEGVGNSALSDVSGPPRP